MNNQFLPISKEEVNNLGWQQLDIILVSGDAYVDHPAWGVAVIGRVLESNGYKVGIIAQPNWHNLADFTKLGRPKLFFGVTSGNVDSMIANYTANKRPRKNDDYSPGAKIGLRPDRSLIIYTNKIKEAYKGVAVILGGIEASLRRIAHYDYWDNTVRRSVLLDSKADALVYGMGEKAIVEIANYLKQGLAIENLPPIRGAVMIKNDITTLTNYVEIDSFETISKDKASFNQAFKLFYGQQNPYTAKTIIQKYAKRYLVCFPAQLPLTTKELDAIYELPFTRNWHPIYNLLGGIKGLATVKFSLVSHRGCAGECSFCGLYMHQGRIIQSRSQQSLLAESIKFTQDKDFKGTITDIGGPTVNLFNASCKIWSEKGYCDHRRCLIPTPCNNLYIDYKKTLAIYDKICHLPKVKHLFIGSGFRYDLLLMPEAEEYFQEISKNYISGQMKVAPEHINDQVLKIMNKPSSKFYKEFIYKVREFNRHNLKKLYLVNYFITSHPGCSLKEAQELELYCLKQKMRPEQIQDFIPLPLTVSGVIYYTHKDPFTGQNIYVPISIQERLMQRTLLQPRSPKNSG